MEDLGTDKELHVLKLILKKLSVKAWNNSQLAQKKVICFGEHSDEMSLEVPYEHESVN